MKAKPTIYFDMDGTIADFYSVAGWLRHLEKEQTKPYRNAQPKLTLETAHIIRELKAAGHKVGVISWSSRCGSPNFHERILSAKLTWLAKHFPFADEIHIIPYGTDKKSVAVDKEGYLIDDEERNLRDWGKKAIDAKEMEVFLKGLL